MGSALPVIPLFMYAQRALSSLDKGDFEFRFPPYQGGLGGITDNNEATKPKYEFLFWCMKPAFYRQHLSP
jgi:hypothetical protein